MRRFDAFASGVADVAGSSITFAITTACVSAFMVGGYFIEYNDLWKLISDSFNGYAPLLLLLILQNSQNKDTKAVQAKLDELVSATEGARNELIAIEDESSDIEIEDKRKSKDEC